MKLKELKKVSKVNQVHSYILKSLNSWIGLFIFVLLVVSLVVLGGYEYLISENVKRTLSDRFVFSIYSLYDQLFRQTFLNPWFYGVFGIVLVLEQFIPAKDNQGLLSIGVWQDLIWVFPKLLTLAIILPMYIFFVMHFYNNYLYFLTPSSITEWPSWVRIILAILLGDLVFWFGHLVRHKVQMLWYFHSVHHSQKELNFLTEYRVHPLDDIFQFTIVFIPYFMFQESVMTITTIVWIRHWHTRIYHSNIKTNFGILRYIFVTPQSHRIHHSIEKKHMDKNYGLTFSIWDFLFGTQYKGYDEYPDTGIAEEDFPFEQGSSKLDAIVLIIEQLLYPFRRIVKKQS